MSKLQIEKCLGYFALGIGLVVTPAGCMMIVMALLSAGQRVSLGAGILCCMAGLLGFIVAASCLHAFERNEAGCVRRLLHHEDMRGLPE
ncbi:MAG: hypothetical protein L0H70_07955 [Xanthomonadales bacterium]|nr:hypothetical protein [Xanthomonadales bacterium]